MPESADGINFSGSKVVCFTNVESVRNFVRVFFFETKCLLEILQGCKIIQTVFKCFPSSRFEPRSFAKCLQNLLIEKKSVERIWRFSKGWT